MGRVTHGEEWRALRLLARLKSLLGTCRAARDSSLIGLPFSIVLGGVARPTHNALGRMALGLRAQVCTHLIQATRTDTAH